LAAKISSFDPALTAVCTAYATPPLLTFLHPPIVFCSMVSTPPSLSEFNSPRVAPRTTTPRRWLHGGLWEIMIFLGQLLVGIIIIAALAAAVLWLFGFI
jgi:hypothetical protein